MLHGRDDERLLLNLSNLSLELLNAGLVGLALDLGRQVPQLGLEREQVLLVEGLVVLLQRLLNYLLKV